MTKKDDNETYKFDTEAEAEAFAAGLELGASLAGGMAETRVVKRKKIFVVKAEVFEAEHDCPRPGDYGYEFAFS